jgi:cytosine/adenosine deaminase-related metal-dependent hydrolase
MQLTNFQLHGKQGPWSLEIQDGKIASLTPGILTRGNHTPGTPESITSGSNPKSIPPETATLDLNGSLLLPGLINSHDHLDFNLFPSLGNTRYSNYRQWGNDIHTTNKEDIQAILKIPQNLRTQWGIYKNLLNGFTTVVNHGEYLTINDSPITVFQDCYNLHSVGFERNWRWRLNRHKRHPWPIVLHVGEGTDKTAKQEISQLLRWNLFHRRLIGIHGVAMTERQARHFKALVWCPASNYFLLDQTAPINKLRNHTSILFGTDSTLTASWDAWAQIRMALQDIDEPELLSMLTTNPASAWGLTDRGQIEKGLRADLLITRNKSLSTLTPDDILLVLHQGKIVLFDPELKYKIPCSNHQIGPNDKYVSGDINGLMQQIRTYTNGYASPLFLS